MRYSNFTLEDEKNFAELTKKGAAATFIYSRNVCSNGELYKYDENDREIRTIAVSGVVLVPLSFFSRFLDVSVEQNGNCAILKYNGNEVSVSSGDTCYKTKSGKSEFKVAAEFKNGIIYLPIIDVAKALGFFAGSYYENRMVVVGCEEVIDTLDSSDSLCSAGAYFIFGSYETEKFTSLDYKAARLRWKERLVGNSRINDISDQAVAEKIAVINQKCKQAQDTMNKEGDPIILWGDSVPVESHELGTQYGNIAKMAKGYSTFGSEYYHNKELLCDILYGLEWMYRHMYGEAEIAGTGWRDVHAFNWWWWFVGAPEHLTDIMFMLEDEISLEDKKRYLKCFKWITTWMCTAPSNSMSRISICTKVAIAIEDAEMLKKEYEDFDYLLELTERANGPHIDYVDYTHGLPHNMSYGILNLDRVLLVASVLSGTALEFSSPQQYNQFGMAKYMYEPAMYCGQGFSMFIGRSLTREGYESGVSALINLMPMLGVFGSDEDLYLKRLIKRNSVNERIRKLIRAGLSFYDLAKYNDIINDDTLVFDNDYEYAHSWFTGDRAAQHRNDYAVGIALSSNRQPAYESINGENKSGWHSGDGAMYLYTKYDDNAYETRNFIKNINVAYRFPGTTEDDREREIRSIRYGKSWKPNASFAGSIQIKDKYIVAAMDFESYNFEGPDENIVDTGAGVGLAVHLNDLVSKKAWFCFDDEIIALSAGITSTMNSPVKTTVDHRRIVRDEEFSQFVGSGKKVERLEKNDFSKEFKNASWVNMEGHCGFVLLEKGDLYINRYQSSACQDQSFFEIGLSHGKNPENASYAYAVIPYATNDKLTAYYAAPDVEIISNTKDLQAVREKGLNITGYVFHAPGKCENLKADVPLIATVCDEGDTIEIIVTDPTHELGEGSFTIFGDYEIVELSKKITAKKSKAEITFTVDFELANGRPFKAVLGKK